MAASERRVLTRFNIRTPLRFRTTSLAGDRSDHFTEAINVSRGGFYFATSAPLTMGMPIEADAWVLGWRSSRSTPRRSGRQRLTDRGSYGMRRLGAAFTIALRLRYAI